MKKIIFIIFLNISFYTTHSFAKESCEEFFQINFNDYKSTNNKFLFAVESDGLCEYGMGQDPDLAFNDCEKWRKENSIVGTCEPYASENQIVWKKPDLYNVSIKKFLASKSNIASVDIVGADNIKFKNSLCTNFLLSKFEEFIENENLFNRLFYMTVAEENNLCIDGRGETINQAMSECERRKVENSIGGTCELFSINNEIVWGKPELYEDLIESQMVIEGFKEEPNIVITDEYLDSISFGMWENWNVIQPADPSTLQKVVYIGEEKRKILEPSDDREDKSRRFYFKTSTYVYDAYFENGKIIEVLVYFKNTHKIKGEYLAEEYSYMLGQMPNVLLQRLDGAHIYADVQGISNASANTRIINIHVKGENGYSFGKSIEELFIHELVHASLDKPIHGTYKKVNKIRHKNDISKSVKLSWRGWRKAVKGDKKKYVNDYAKTTIHEDLAESFIAWIALRYSKRTSDWDKALIEKKVPNRMKFFDEQQFDMYPLVLNTE